MTLVEFNKNLNKIDFQKGDNILKLEDYLLACLTLLDFYKSKEPTYQLFLIIFDQARNGKQVKFDPSWKEHYDSNKELNEYEFNKLTHWERVRDDLRSLATDLIITREIRSQPDYKNKYIYYGEWDSEGGTTFYNGITPGAILGYAATRFEGNYSTRDFQENKVTWEQFTAPIWIGISYE